MYSRSPTTPGPLKCESFIVSSSPHFKPECNKYYWSIFKSCLFSLHDLVKACMGGGKVQSCLRCRYILYVCHQVQRLRSRNDTTFYMHPLSWPGSGSKLTSFSWLLWGGCLLPVVGDRLAQQVEDPAHFVFCCKDTLHYEIQTSIASYQLPQATPMSQILCWNIEFQSGTQFGL